MIALPRTLVLLTLASCASVTFDRQEVTLDRDPAADSLTLELVYHDLGAIAHRRRAFFDFGGTPEGPDVRAAADLVQAVLAGEPVAVLLLPYADVPLGAPPELADVDPATLAAAGTDLTRDDLAYLQSVRVTAARVELDDQGRLVLTQRIVYPDLTRGVALANAALRRFLLGEHQEGSEAALTELEAATYRVALADARAGRDWLTWGDGGLVLRVPLDSRHLVALLRGQADEWVRDLDRYTRGGGRDSLGELTLVVAALRELAHLATDLRVDGDHLVLTLGDAEGDLSFTVGPDLDGRLGLEDFRPALREELERRGVSFPAAYAPPE